MPLVLAEHFALVDQALLAHRQYWQVRAFETLNRPWSEGLSQCVEALSIEQIWQLDASDRQLADFFEPWLPVGQKLVVLCEQYQQRPAPSLVLDERLGIGISGRKWQQIKAFTAFMPKPAAGLLEWCAGKGHLGRIASVHQACEVESVEWDQSLCSAGESLAGKYKADQTFVCADVMDAGTREHIPLNGMSIALHACGDLHTQLLKGWVERKGAQLLLAPCCYHLTKEPRYLPLSVAAGASAIQLTKSDLSLPLQSTVTGGLRARRLRDLEATWRLSFDVLQRHIRGVDEYLPLPNIKKGMLTAPFAEFLVWAAETKGLQLPPALDVDACLVRGEARLLEVRRTEIVAKLFRRALELWLVLDRALFLQEQGAQVEVFNFCDYQLTPRNFMIRASHVQATARE